MILNEKQQNIIRVILEKGVLQSSAVHQELLKNGEEISLVSVKRLLSEMTKLGVLTTSGSGRNTSYDINTIGRVFANIDDKNYTEIDPDKRFGLDRYNFSLFLEFPNEVFDENELYLLDSATGEYHRRTKDLSKVLADKELQRLIIELSWKSSKIEGNTYSLLDTEKLIMEHKEATGHKKDEAKMILNHKDAFLFIREHETEFKTLNISNLEKLHAILVEGLGVNRGLRKGLVGVTGSKYRPLDNIHQIREAVESLGLAVSKAKTPYDRALLAIVGLSYIQPFEDGNKRTGRLMANALLLSHGSAPLSYRSVDENEYRAAMLVFYEINTILPFKKIFKEQYVFAANNYAVK
jgi:hypothetical protein